MHRLTISRCKLIEKTHLAEWILTRCASTAQSAAAADNKSSTSADPIIIPKKINRSPTDLLQALSETVGIDSTMPQYKYHDDPFLLPQSYNQRIRYAMSEESGRKATRWIVNEHADCFNVSSRKKGFIGHFS